MLICQIKLTSFFHQLLVFLISRVFVFDGESAITLARDKNIRWNQGHKCYEILLPLDLSLLWDFIKTSTFTSWNSYSIVICRFYQWVSKSLWTSLWCHMSPHLRHWTFYNLLWPATLIIIFMPNIPLYLDFMPLDPILDHWAFILRFCMRINEPHTAYSTWVCRFSCS